MDPQTLVEMQDRADEIYSGAAGWQYLEADEDVKIGLGQPYSYECEAVTGTGPAPLSGETVAMCECTKPAERQDDGSYLCAEHARKARRV